MLAKYRDPRYTNGVPNIADFPLTSQQAADYVGVHVDTIKRWAADGKVRALRTPGGWWRFAAADLDAVLSPDEPTEASA
jgi:excisionase family DNA binding protein